VIDVTLNMCKNLAIKILKVEKRTQADNHPVVFIH